jgi:myo-inositol-1(or 4)-monophosphatase
MTVKQPDAAFFAQLSTIAREAWRSASDASDIENKAAQGFDPVTNADRAIERSLRDAIALAFPGDGISGEELADRNPGARRRWSIDPIDGTRSFICHLSSWAILVGHVVDGRPVAGMIDAPVIDELLIALNGATTRNGIAVRTSGIARLAHARLSTTDPFLFNGAEIQAFNRVRGKALMTRYGLDALGYGRVATGGLDLVIESGLKPHDYEALIPIILCAGGHVGDWSGNEDFGGGRLVAAASRELYDEAVAVLSW